MTLQGVGPMTLTLAQTHLSSQLWEARQPSLQMPALSHSQHLLPRSRYQPPCDHRVTRLKPTVHPHSKHRQQVAPASSKDCQSGGSSMQKDIGIGR